MQNPSRTAGETGTLPKIVPKVVTEGIRQKNYRLNKKIAGGAMRKTVAFGKIGISVSTFEPSAVQQAVDIASIILALANSKDEQNRPCRNDDEK